MLDVELFAGGGGLAIGLREAGFRPSTLYERDVSCCKTLRFNLKSSTPTLEGTVVEDDVSTIRWGDIEQEVRLLAAGAPCQPFSLGGKHRAEKDGRNLFPQVMKAIRVLKPRGILVENVRGLLRTKFQPYFEYIMRQLKTPAIAPHSDETWDEHDARLRKHHCSSTYEPEYDVDFRMVDAANFGIPQNRHRVFIVGTRIDLPVYEFPKRTHSQAALVRVQKLGEYWDRHKILPSLKHDVDIHNDGLLPWVTVRDAFKGLPLPSRDEDSSEMNHWRIPGARSYAGHAGSILDWTSKTIKAGVHGVPGGENTVIDANGVFRYYTLRETARIQTFPDTHYFEGARIHVTKQIGNAVPSRLAAIIAKPLFDIIGKETTGVTNYAGRKPS